MLSTPSMPSQKVNTRNHTKRKIHHVESDSGIQYLGSGPVCVLSLLATTQVEVFMGHILVRKPHTFNTLQAVAESKYKKPHEAEDSPC